VSAPRIEWKTRKGTGLNTISHAFKNGVGQCRAARIPPGTPCAYQGRLVREFEPAQLAPDGRPFGRVCTHCDRNVRAERLAEAS
jgi:hypothetical protein